MAANQFETFRAALLAAGLDYSGEIIADGRIHRFKAQGDRDKNSWYTLHLGGVPAGSFGCWKRGFSETWRAGGTEPPTAAERIEIERRRQQQQVERDQSQRRKHKTATERAQAILAAAAPATDLHRYLTRKGVKAAPGLRVGHWPQRNLNGCLLVPLRMISGEVATLQAIFTEKGTGNRDKDFLQHGEKRGAHFIVGDPGTADTVVIAEGYATAATIFDATGFCSVMAVDAGNLLPVAQAFRAAHPGKRIVIAADNDQHTPGNPGLSKARAAAQAIGAALVWPEFAEGEPGSDFNDMAGLHGLDAVRDAIARTEEPAPTESEPPAPAVALCERSNFDGDLRKLAEAPAAAKLATARSIVRRYAWQCPWKRSYADLCRDVRTGLSEAEAREVSRLIAWIERKARQSALAGTGIDARTLHAAGIKVLEVGTISEAYANTTAHPEALVLVKADLGAGKTSGILQPLAVSTDETTIAITNRQSLVADLCSRLKLSRYDTIQKKDISSCTELGICLKSITNPKFAEVLGRARMVLVDEISAVVRECHEPTPSGVLGKFAKTTWEKLGILLRNADLGACGVDADLNTADVLALQSEMEGKPIRVIVVRPKQTPMSITFSPADALLAALLTAVERGQPCRVFSDSAKQVRQLAALLKERFPEKAVMAIHSQGATATTGSPEVQSVLADINAAVHEIDVLLHTPAVESGVSLTTEHFQKTFGLYCGSVAPQAFIQMMRRDRTAKTATIAILGNGLQFAKTACAELLNDMGDAHRITVATAASKGRYSMTFEPATPWDARVAEYRAARNARTNTYAQGLWFALEALGATVHQHGDGIALPLSEVLTAKSEAADLAKAEAREAIMSAPDISADEREVIQRQYQPTPEDCAKTERYDLRQTLAVREVDGEALDLWREGKVRGQVERFEALTSAPLAGLAADATEDAARVPLAARSNRLAEAEAIRTAFECFGFDVDTGGGEVTESSAREAFENLKASPLRPVMEHTGLLRLDRMPKYPARWVGDFLNRLGLTLELAEQRGPRGDRERVYRIAQGETWDRAGRWMTAPGWEQMSAIAARRQHRCTHGPISLSDTASVHGTEVVA